LLAAAVSAILVAVPAAMKKNRFSTPSIPVVAVAFGLASALSASAQFYGDPPDETHPWAVHDMNRPQPPKVEPGKTVGSAPSDAVVLFDGTGKAFKDNWRHEKQKRKGDWKIVGGMIQCTPKAGNLRTKAEFGDCQLHIEWAEPADIKGSGQGRGNSGIFLMGLPEIQVLDNYSNPTYPDGSAGSLYGVMPPMANALKKTGEWQVYDIVFRRPVFRDGKLVDQGYVTVLLNGVLVQDHTPLEGSGGHKHRSHPKPFPEKGPLVLQDHGNPVRFRNIWYRALPKRPVEGGTDGMLTPGACAAKRAEIAADIRKDAAGKAGKDKMLRLMESLCYQVDKAAVAEIDKLGADFVKNVKATPANKIGGRRGEVMQVNNAVKYLVRHKRMPADWTLSKELDALVKANGWGKKK
jgi:hypothetical protein